MIYMFLQSFWPHLNGDLFDARYCFLASCPGSDWPEHGVKTIFDSTESPQVCSVVAITFVHILMSTFNLTNSIFAYFFDLESTFSNLLFGTN